MPVTDHLRKLLEQRDALTRTEAAALLNLVLLGQATDVEIAAILGALAARGETAEELAGFVDAMRAAAVPMPLDAMEQSLLVDTCGTGGDGADTFNISTAAALVAAAAGAKVAKHGNRALHRRADRRMCSRRLAFRSICRPKQQQMHFVTHGFAYLHAPAMHTAMKAVLPVRRALGVRTAFNLLGPLANPAGAQAQIMGVYAADRVPIVAETMLLLGVRHAFVVHGFVDSTETRGMDELSISGPSLLAEVREGRVLHRTITPEEVGLERSSIAMLRGGDAQENAAILHAIFAGKPGPARDVVALNAAAVLVTANLATDLATGILLAQQTIDDGSVLRLVQALRG